MKKVAFFNSEEKQRKIWIREKMDDDEMYRDLCARCISAICSSSSLDCCGAKLTCAKY